MQGKKVELKLDWATYKSAKYACEHWHYSGCVPAGKLMKIGVWENSIFIGVVLFSRGANNNIGKPYSLSQTQVCELTRVALRSHENTVSRIVRIAMIFLKRQDIRLIVSYADPVQGHKGGIYQAGNWVYAGKSVAQREVLINGIFKHKRSVYAKYGTASIVQLREMGINAVPSDLLWKHIYLYPLSKKSRADIEKFKKPYPRK